MKPETLAGDMPLLRSIKATAALLGIGVSTTWKLVSRGRLEVVRIGRRTLVTNESISKLVSGAS